MELIQSELTRLTTNCAIRRAELLSEGRKMSSRKRMLGLAAGILALLSAGTVAAAAAKLLGRDGYEYLAAAGAFISGVISLIGSFYYRDEEVVERLEGSSKYLALRDSVYLLAIDPRLSDESKFDRIADLQKKYADLDNSYAKYCKVDEKEVHLLMSSSYFKAVHNRNDEVRKRVGKDAEVRRLSAIVSECAEYVHWDLAQLRDLWAKKPPVRLDAF